MHSTTLSSLVVLVLGTATAAALSEPPNGQAAQYSIYDHVGCDDHSTFTHIVYDSSVGSCQNFANPTISVKMEAAHYNCTSKLPTRECLLRVARQSVAENDRRSRVDLHLYLLTNCSESLPLS